MLQENNQKVLVIHYPYPEEIIDFILVRKDYLELLEGDRCACEALALFEFWTENKFAQFKHYNESDDETLWISKSAIQLRQDLYEGYGINTVNRALSKLVEKELLKRRKNPNPQLIFDRTWQYQFNISRVQQALNDLYTSRQNS